jgi:hypothetical protein
MNVQLKDITVTARDGRVSHLEQVYIRGSHVRFFIVPDMLRYDQLRHTLRTREQAGNKYADLVLLQERAHVPESQRPRKRSRSGPREGDGEQSACRRQGRSWRTIERVSRSWRWLEERGQGTGLSVEEEG